LAKFKQQAGKIPLKKRPKVFFMLWDSPVMSIGKKSFLTDYINYAGGRSITAKISQGYFSSSLEFVLASQPEVMICPSMHVNKAKEFVVRPGWKDVKAVKTGRIYSGLNPDLMFRMSPRMLESIQVIRDCIYPKAKKSNK
jgi:cobalamin transport system substrate-binding protein